jgi:hypothetical protein
MTIHTLEAPQTVQCLLVGFAPCAYHVSELPKDKGFLVSSTDHDYKLIRTILTLFIG